MKNIIYPIINKFFLSDCSDYNPLNVRRACRSKQKARMAFQQNNLPFAKGLIFINPLKAFKFVKEHGFPVVIKPNVGGFSRGAYFPIVNYLQLFKAIIGVKKWWPTSIIEQYLTGKNYRIVVTKNGIMSILERHPPFIIGDGTKTISELIDIENILRKQMGLIPVMQIIPKNKSIIGHLQQQKLNLLSVPNSGNKIYLNYKIALKLGSSVEIIAKDKLSTNNRKDLQKILDFFGANILGIDVICEQGIEIDFSQQKTIFLELNSRPFLKMHDYNRYGKKEDLSNFYQQLKTIQLNDNNSF